MKKFNYLIYIFILMVSFIGVTSAATTKNGISITPNSDPNDKEVKVTCVYGNLGGYTIEINRINKNDTQKKEDGDISNGQISQTDATLKKYGFLDDKGYFDCPLYAHTNYDSNKKEPVVFDISNNNIAGVSHWDLDVSKSTCVGACMGEQYDNTVKNWTCDYTGSSGKKAQTKYDGSYWLIDNDGIKYSMLEGNIDKNCGDFFYEGSDTDPIYVDKNIILSNETSQIEKWYNTLCPDGVMTFEYYCSGSCKFDNKNLTCESLKQKLEDRKKPSPSHPQNPSPSANVSAICNDNGVKKSLKFVGNLILAAKICVPLLLIIMGSIDFGKAVVGSKDGEVEKAGKMFFIRAIAAVSIFLLPTVIYFIFELIPTSGGYNECSRCVFSPNECNIE